jgi:small subunit ribosomal protein S7
LRRPVKKRNKPAPDIRFDSTDLSKFINHVMNDGKKSVAETIVYDAFEIIKKETKSEPLAVFDDALDKIGPDMEVRSRRVGGANYQVPYEVRPERRKALAMRWMLDAARNRKGAPMANRLAEEIMLASKGEGEAFKKKENMHKMAESNKAFAHFAW